MSIEALVVAAAVRLALAIENAIDSAFGRASASRMAAQSPRAISFPRDQAPVPREAGMIVH